MSEGTPEMLRPSGSAASMPNVARAIGAAGRRLMAARWVEGVWAFLTAGALLAAAAVGADWYFRLDAPAWLIGVVPVLAPVAAWTLVVLASRRSAAGVAGLLDDRLALAGRLSAAIALARGGAMSDGTREPAFASIALRDAERSASNANIKDATPIGRGWRAGAACAVLAAGVGALAWFAPTRPPMQPKVDERTEQTAATIAQTIESMRGLPPVREGDAGGDADEPGPVARAEDLAALEELERDLREGGLAPDQAAAGAAEVLENLAERAEEEAERRERASREIADRLAQTEPIERGADRSPTRDPLLAELERHLRDGAFSEAGRTASELARRAEELSPNERAELAEQLERLADRLDHEPSDTAAVETAQANAQQADAEPSNADGSTRERAEALPSDGTSEQRDRSGAAREPATAGEGQAGQDQPSENPSDENPSDENQSDENQPGEDASDEGEPSDRQLNDSQRADSEGSEPQQTSRSERTDPTRQDSGQEQRDTPGDAERLADAMRETAREMQQRPTQTEQSTGEVEQRARQESGEQQTREQETGSQETGSQETGSQETGSQETGSQETGSQESGSQETGQRDRGQRSEEGTAEQGTDQEQQPRSGQTSSDQTSPDQPSPDQPGEPRPGPEGQPGESPAQQETGGDQPREQQAGREGDEQGGERSAPREAVDQAQREPGQLPGQQPTQDAPGTQPDQQPGQQPGRQPGEQPGPSSQQRPGAREGRQGSSPLERELDRIERSRRAGDRAADEARAYRERASELLDQASGGDDRDESQEPRTLGPGREDTGRPPTQQGHGGTQPDRGGGSTDQRPFDPSRTTPVDATGGAQGDVRPDERIVGDWFGPRPDGEGDGRQASGPVDRSRVLREASDRADRAIERRAVPRRYRDVVRRVFDRLEREHGGPASAPAPPPAAPAERGTGESGSENG